MAQQTVGVGTTAGDGSGDPARTAFTKVNANFTELYAATVTAGTGLSGGGAVSASPTIDFDPSELAEEEDGGELNDFLLIADTSASGAARRTLVSEFIANAGLLTAAFTTVAVSGQDDVVADALADTLTLVAGSNITITTSAAGDSVTIAASGDVGITTVQEEGSGLTQRATLNFIGAGLTAADDAGNARTNVTVATPLNALAGTTPAADKGVMFSGASTATTFDLSAAGRALIDDADAAAQRTTLGVTNKIVMALEILDPQVGRYAFALDPGFAGTIVSLVRQANQGTVTFDVEIATVDVTSLAGLTATSSKATTGATGANTFTASQIIELNITAVSGGPQRATFTLQCTVTP